MEPTYKANQLPTCSCKPSTDSIRIGPAKRAVLFSVRIMALAGLFILSTSYQSHRNELLLLENDLFLPALKEDLSGFFRQTGNADPAAGENISLGTIPLIKDFYSSVDYRPVWTLNTALSDRAETLIGMLGDARMYGLDSSLFAMGEIRNELACMKNRNMQDRYLASRMKLELLLTDACLQYMTYLKMGYREFDTALFSGPAAAELPLILSRAMEGDDFRQSILSVQPSFTEYRKLQQALAGFLNHTVITDARVSIPDPSKDSVLFRQAARQVLENLGYLKPGSTEEHFLPALKKFQYFHGLEPDGKPGRNTREALAQSTGDRYRQIALNLDRMRKENPAAQQYVFVNIPAYQMRIYKENKMIGNSRVIVGTVKTPTPLVSSRIERIITNPVWQVPRSITVNEMLPRLKSDSGYLSRNRLRLMDENRNAIAYHEVDWNTVSADNFSLRVRQESGSDNSLGRVKFVFPNPYSVYLHDTPGKQSFSKDIRAMSHGCVRVQHPEMLADYLVREFSGRKGDVDVVGWINNGIRREINLEQPVDLYIQYITCEADDDLNIFFYSDIYGRDKKDLKKLEFLM